MKSDELNRLKGNYEQEKSSLVSDMKTTQKELEPHVVQLQQERDTPQNAITEYQAYTEQTHQNFATYQAALQESVKPLMHCTKSLMVWLGYQIRTTLNLVNSVSCSQASMSTITRRVPRQIDG